MKLNSKCATPLSLRPDILIFNRGRKKGIHVNLLTQERTLWTGPLQLRHLEWPLMNGSSWSLQSTCTAKHRHPRAEAACRVGKNPHWFLKYYFLFATPDNSALYCFPLLSCLRVSSERVAYFAGVRCSWKPMALSFPLSSDLGGTCREMLHSHLFRILFTNCWTFLAYRLFTGNWLNSQIFRIFSGTLYGIFSSFFMCSRDMGLWFSLLLH